MYETITACIPVHLLDKMRLAKYNAVGFNDNTALMIIYTFTFVLNQILHQSWIHPCICESAALCYNEKGQTCISLQLLNFTLAMKFRI